MATITIIYYNSLIPTAGPTHIHVMHPLHYRTLPLLILHRKNWDIVYPRLELEEAELADLSERGTYVAGFTDSTVEGRTDLYDLFINGEDCHFAWKLTVLSEPKSDLETTNDISNVFQVGPILIPWWYNSLNIWSPGYRIFTDLVLFAVPEASISVASQSRGVCVHACMEWMFCIYNNHTV